VEAIYNSAYYVSEPLPFRFALSVDANETASRRRLRAADRRELFIPLTDRAPEYAGALDVLPNYAGYVAWRGTLDGS
jgi:hypothetical protein